MESDYLSMNQQRIMMLTAIDEFNTTSNNEFIKNHIYDISSKLQREVTIQNATDEPFIPKTPIIIAKY